MIVLDVKFVVKEGCRDEVIAAMKEVAEETLKEDGCAEYRFAMPFSAGKPSSCLRNGRLKMHSMPILRRSI